ncbi:hypothetical protein QBC39DRAFT_333671 [Podospora conica]|nr:hypothetical protein QBC39DRAFT_333671 [Schizothecium conicum]
MKTVSILSILATLALGTQALVPARRWETDPFPKDPKGTPSNHPTLITQFQAGSAWKCDSLELSYAVDLSEVTKDGTCNPFPTGIKSIRVGKLDPQCRVKVYSLPGCSGDGLEIGVGGCYSNDPIYGYKVVCPDKN